MRKTTVLDQRFYEIISATTVVIMLLISYTVLLSICALAFTYQYPKGQIIAFWYKDKKVLNFGNAVQCSISTANIFNEIRQKMLEIKANSFSFDGSVVDYEKIKVSTLFAEYSDLVKQLKFVDLSKLTPSGKKAAFINIYNSLIVHAIIDGLLDLSGGTLARLKLYASASYDIGGFLFSLNEIENGLLRINRKSAVPLTFRPFRKQNDPRKMLMVEYMDARIHFALNCGAKSCPPIGVYSCDAEELDEQLSLATRSFLDGSVALDASSKTISLSMLFSWYKEDFGNNDEEIIGWVKSHCSLKLRENIQLFEDSLKGESPKITYSAYDWSLNSA